MLGSTHYVSEAYTPHLTDAFNNLSVFALQDYQVKEQCRNCTFLNGQFADECEMCGEPLSNHSQQHATKSYNRPGNRDKYL